jgi:hypothetical protein
MRQQLARRSTIAFSIFLYAIPFIGRFSVTEAYLEVILCVRWKLDIHSHLRHPAWRSMCIAGADRYLTEYIESCRRTSTEESMNSYWAQGNVRLHDGSEKAFVKQETETGTTMKTVGNV